MVNQYTKGDYETHEDDSERFDEPIKVSWTGYARSRISEYNGDASDENVGDDSPMSPERFSRAVSRLKTNVVIVTPEEADAVRYEIGCYDYTSRVWMNSSMQKSLDLLASKITDAMAERGYQPVYNGQGNFGGYYQEDEADRVQAEVDRRHQEHVERRQELRDKTGEIYSKVRDDGATNFWYHGGEAKIVFKKPESRDGAEKAAGLLREAGCSDVTIDEVEYKDGSGLIQAETDRYTVFEVVGDIPESGYGLD